MTPDEKPIIGKNYEKDIYFGVLDPKGPFPSKIHAHAFVYEDPSVTYVPLIRATAITVMENDTVDHCMCSNCNDTINMFDTYCCHCGARIIGKKFEGDDYEENSSIHVLHQ